MRLPPDVEAKALELAGVNPVAGLKESAFQARVVAMAKANGWEIYHTHDSRRSEPGFPDLVLIRGRVLLVAELKVKRNKTTAAQERWLELFRGVGARVFLWRPEDWAQIRAELEACE